MDRLNTQEGKQGMLFTVCDDHIRIQRREFVYDQTLGDDWILPVGKAAERPFVYAKRIPVRTAPEFPQGASVKVALLPPKAEKGKPAPKDPTHVGVTFPAAETRNKCRVFEYEVQAHAARDRAGLPRAGVEGRPAGRLRVRARRPAEGRPPPLRRAPDRVLRQEGPAHPFRRRLRGIAKFRKCPLARPQGV